MPEDDPVAKLDHVDPAMIAGRELFVGPGNDDPKALVGSLRTLIDAGVQLVHCPDSERSVIEALARKHRGLCIYWSPDGRPKAPGSGQRCVSLKDGLLPSPLALVRRTGENSRPVRWTWHVAERLLHGQ